MFLNPHNEPSSVVRRGMLTRRPGGRHNYNKLTRIYRLTRHSCVSFALLDYVEVAKSLDERVCARV